MCFFECHFDADRPQPLILAIVLLENMVVQLPEFHPKIS